MFKPLLWAILKLDLVIFLFYDHSLLQRQLLLQSLASFIFSVLATAITQPSVFRLEDSLQHANLLQHQLHKIYQHLQRAYH